MSFIKKFEYFSDENVDIWKQYIDKDVSSFIDGEYYSSKFDYLIGKVILDFKVNNSNDQVAFLLENNECLVLHHEQDCCEQVLLDDINGDPYDILNCKILLSEERTSIDHGPVEEFYSATWTFYTIRTLRGTLDIRFVGTSNGYYSEECDVSLVKNVDWWIVS